MVVINIVVLDPVIGDPSIHRTPEALVDGGVGTVELSEVVAQRDELAVELVLLGDHDLGFGLAPGDALVKAGVDVEHAQRQGRGLRAGEGGLLLAPFRGKLRAASFDEHRRGLQIVRLERLHQGRPAPRVAQRDARHCAREKLHGGRGPGHNRVVQHAPPRVVQHVELNAHVHEEFELPYVTPERSSPKAVGDDLLVGLRGGSEEQRRHLDVPRGDGVIQGHVPKAIAYSHVCSVGDEELGEMQVTVGGSHVESCAVVEIACVQVGALGNEHAEHVEVACACGDMHARRLVDKREHCPLPIEHLGYEAVLSVDRLLHGRGQEAVCGVDVGV
mmetsp:Transcript_18605/g.54525  ORF Transcript_18605/g.54525 Transcript_18605/m.54525 type:complete len:331 (-) Transcript_18605:1915-2907(-)